MSYRLLVEHAREKLGAPPEWDVYRFVNMPPLVEGAPSFFGLTGAVAPSCKSGPRKGQANWSRRDRATERFVAISAADHDEWLAAWSARTGLCHRCDGEGRRPARSSTVGGTAYGPCAACGGSGKKPEGGDR